MDNESENITPSALFTAEDEFDLEFHDFEGDDTKNTSKEVTVQKKRKKEPKEEKETSEFDREGDLENEKKYRTKRDPIKATTPKEVRGKNKANDNKKKQNLSEVFKNRDKKAETFMPMKDKKPLLLSDATSKKHDDEFTKLINDLNNRELIPKELPLVIATVKKAGYKHVMLDGCSYGEAAEGELILLTQEAFNRISKKYKSVSKVNLNSEEIADYFSEQVDINYPLLEKKILLKRDNEVMIGRPKLGDRVLPGYDELVTVRAGKTKRALDVPEFEIVSALGKKDMDIRKSQKELKIVRQEAPLISSKTLARIGYMVGKPREFSNSVVYSAIKVAKENFRIIDHYVGIANNLRGYMEALGAGFGSSLARQIALCLMQIGFIKHLKGITIPVTKRNESHIPDGSFTKKEMEDNSVLAATLCEYAGLGDYYKVTSQSIKSNPKKMMKKPKLTLVS